MNLLETCINLCSFKHSFKAFGITSGQPYMVNMAFDPMMAGCLIYLIQAGHGWAFWCFLYLFVFVSCIHVQPFSQGHSWPHGIGLGRHSFCRLMWPGKQANDDGITQRQYHCTQRCLAFPRADGCVILCGVANGFLWFLAWREEDYMRGFPGPSVFPWASRDCTSTGFRSKGWASLIICADWTRWTRHYSRAHVESWDGGESFVCRTDFPCTWSTPPFWNLQYCLWPVYLIHSNSVMKRIRTFEATSNA